VRACDFNACGDCIGAFRWRASRPATQRLRCPLTLGSLTAIAFDKTGTLTTGSVDERRVLSVAAALAVESSHPLALAILGRAKSDNTPVPPACSCMCIACSPAPAQQRISEPTHTITNDLWVGNELAGCSA
jgi:cation transport ATPase